MSKSSLIEFEIQKRPTEKYTVAMSLLTLHNVDSELVINVTGAAADDRRDGCIAKMYRHSARLSNIDHRALGL